MRMTSACLSRVSCMNEDVRPAGQQPIVILMSNSHVEMRRMAQGYCSAMRKLKHHEQKLLKKVNLYNWKSDQNIREIKVLDQRSDKRGAQILCALTSKRNFLINSSTGSIQVDVQQDRKVARAVRKVCKWARACRPVDKLFVVDAWMNSALNACSKCI